MALILPHRVGIDCRRRELCMAQPTLHEMQGTPLYDTGHTRAMPHGAHSAGQGTLLLCLVYSGR